MVRLDELESYCNRLLKTTEFDDYCPNGLQVDAGVATIRHLVSGVTASQALIDAAVARGADLLLVHHGFFWRGEALPLIGVKGRRVRALMRGGLSLLAYHLPLDMHPELGNNALLGRLLGLSGARPSAAGDGMIWEAMLDPGVPAADFGCRLAALLQREPLHIPAGADVLRRVGWCSGAAQGLIEQAAASGLNAFVSGEISEQTVHLARELDIHYYAAGHHATECLGVRALGDHLAENFDLSHEFIDIPNPV